MRVDRPESTTPKKRAMMKTATRTTAVPERVSFLEGQVTFFNSVLTSLKNCLAPSYFSRIENAIVFVLLKAFPKHVDGCHIPGTVYGSHLHKFGAWQARRDLNPHHPDLESGALSVRATGLFHCTRFEDCFALWNRGLGVTLPHGSLLLTNHSSYASQLNISRGKLEAKDFSPLPSRPKAAPLTSNIFLIRLRPLTSVLQLIYFVSL